MTKFSIFSEDMQFLQMNANFLNTLDFLHLIFKLFKCFRSHKRPHVERTFYILF